MCVCVCGLCVYLCVFVFVTRVCVCGKDSRRTQQKSRRAVSLHRVSTSTTESGASAGTHGYTGNTQTKEWRSGSHSTARQLRIINTPVRGVRASRGRSTSAPRIVVSDPWASGWGPKRELLCAVQTANSQRGRQPEPGYWQPLSPKYVDRPLARQLGPRRQHRLDQRIAATFYSEARSRLLKIVM